MRCRIADATRARLKDDHSRVDPVEGLARPELDAGRHLIVAAPRRVQLPAHVAEFLDQRRLDVHVDIFTLQDERKIPILDLSLDFRQDSLNLLAFVDCQQSNMLEHARMGDRTPDVLLEESTIEGDRFGERLHATVRLVSETATPGLPGHSWSSRQQDITCIRFWHSLTQSRQTQRSLSIFPASGCGVAEARRALPRNGPI